MAVCDNGCVCVDTVEETVKCNKTTRDTQKATKDALYLTFFLGVLVDMETGMLTLLDKYPTGDYRLSLFLMLGCICFAKNLQMSAVKVFKGKNSKS